LESPKPIASKVNEQNFDIEPLLGVKPPCYVRKVKNASCCGTKDDKPQQRAQMIRDAVLSEDAGITSLFYVTSGLDVARAALALNFRRAGMKDVYDVSLLAFTEDELADVSRQQTDDSHPCHWAARNHWNFMFTEDNFHRVAEALGQRVRLPKLFGRKKLKDARDTLREHGCRSVASVSESSSCRCQSVSRSSPDPS
jgi:hypothetical protein